MFVYIIVNRESLKLYVGQHRGHNLQKYLQTKFSDAMHQRNAGSHLFRAMRKYPKDVWSISVLVSDLKTQEELDYWERFYIKTLKSQHPGIGYNIEDGGHCGPTLESRLKISAALMGHKIDPESLRKMSEMAKLRVGNKNPFFGRHHSEESINKIRTNNHLGVKQSPETISKRVEKLKNPSSETRLKISEKLKEYWSTHTRTCSEETKDKLAARFISEEQRQHMSEAAKLRSSTEGGRETLRKANKGKKKPPRTEEHRRHLSESLMGHKPTESQLLHQSLAQKGKPKPPRSAEHILNNANAVRAYWAAKKAYKTS